jgi:predicted RNA-binding Zn-ribbon protein involved in translation (DUF1610 family)
VDDYPRTRRALERRFSDDKACRAYLESLRWPDGFVCPRCGMTEAWRTKRDLLLCCGCRRQASVTAGTIFQGSRLPLPLWFRAMWLVTSQENGASALAVQKMLGLGSYETAWAWLHKLRRAMVRPGRDYLSGVVEIDETYIGGVRPGIADGGAPGKALVLVATELGGDCNGRIRLTMVNDGSVASLVPAVSSMVATGSVVRTDGWRAYLPLAERGYQHEISRESEDLGDEMLPSCRRVAGLLERWLMDTHHGATTRSYLPYYLDEFTFRFNRGSSSSRGELFQLLVRQAVQVGPVPYRKLVSQDALGQVESSG